MKLNRKKVLVVALAVCLVAIISMGSLAYFTAGDEVTNTFLVAGSDNQDKDEIFSIDVFEKTPDDTEDQDGYEYEDILPGDELVKEPHVKNTGSYDQYVRVIVTISDATAWINAMGIDFAIEEVFTGYDATMWAKIDKMIEGEPDTITYVLYYADTLAPDAEITLFDHVVIPTSLTQEQAAAFAGGFDITVKAQAVQTANVGDNAYDAFQTVGLAIDA